MRHPLLRDVFEQAGEDAPRITLGNLAVSLNVPVGRLGPLVREGWLKRIAEGDAKLTTGTLLVAPSDAALKWLRQWFQPVLAKPLFSQLDMAELLGVTSAQVIEIAAAHDIPVVWDPALGHTYSMWSARQLLIRVISGRKEVGTRFDRQAFLWNLMEGDSSRMAEIPAYNELLEDEIERVAALAEPQRSLRAQGLRDHFRDASSVLDAAGVVGGDRITCAESLSFGQSQPAGPACESSPNGSESLSQACARIFSIQT